MVDEQLRYLRLIVHYAPLPRDHQHSSPVPNRLHAMYRGLLGENRTPVGCMHFRHGGRIRYGKTGRWMNMGGEGIFFSCSTGVSSGMQQSPTLPVYGSKHSIIMLIAKAGMNLNLFSVFPLDNAQTDEMKDGSLFRYLTCTPLFPMILGSSRFHPLGKC